MLQWLKDKLAEYKKARILKKSGCRTWKQYHRMTDQDFSIRARYVKNAYHGYKFVAKLPDEYYIHHMHLDVKIDTEGWCEENCKGKWRSDWFRGFYDPNYDDFAINDISGFDELYYAFQNEEDYFWFKLKFG